MQYTKILIATTAIVTGLLLAACTSSSLPSGNDYVYQGINFGSDRNANFKKGVQDACRTADGDYTKNHDQFKNNKNYRIGWEDGRLKCKGK
ncbi:MAG TPA: hypothetical protein ENI25_00080 [Epsilonproteobacteria bacterium]|nr:hypothetical protein [Campylobacterota bacterium]